RESPVIHLDLIQDFWKNAEVDDKNRIVHAKIQNKEVIISEDVIREVLALGDAPEYLTCYPKEQFLPVFKRISYEGKFPPIWKKLLHPYWRLLVVAFMSTFSDNRGGLDQLKKEQAAAVAAMVMGWPFNYSRMILENMMRNVNIIGK
ncbi:MAG: hypothetical protein Q8755_03430, partial [Candidatus Phytoplasma australasiaticum]|nr:hypothetical protein [Candidatus Phytoplasma australasiaticum]